MEKIITIVGRQVRFKSTASFLYKYKAQFGRNALADLLNLQGAVDGEGNLKNADDLDLEVLYNVVWVLAKTADSTIPPVEEWLDTFEEFPIVEVFPQLMDMITKSISPSNKKK